MPKTNYAGLVRLCESAHAEQRPQADVKRTLREAIAAKDLDIYSFDFGNLFQTCFGWNEFHTARSTGKLVHDIMEASGPVMTNSFQQISSAVIGGMIMDAYESPEFVVTKLIPTRQSKFDFEKIVGVSEIGDEVQIVKEGDEYPSVGVTEQYRHAAIMRKRGFKVSLTREVIFFDQTGRLQQMASGGAKSQGQNREKRAIDCVIDENDGAKSAILGGHRYHYLGNAIATYGNSSGNHDWDNLQASNGLVDWTDIEAASLLFDELVDPVTAEPIVFQIKHLLCARQLELTALRIRNATEINVVTPGYATSGNPTETKVGNPYANKFEVITSPYIKSRLATDTDWFLGDIGMAFEYVEAWPAEVKQLASGTQLEFDRDIVQQYRFSEYGNYSTKEPRAMEKNTA